jgi:hypothetical protein
MKIGNKKGEGTLLSICEGDYPAIMYIDEDWIKKKERGHYYQGGEVDYPAIMYTDEDWKQKRRGDISIKV